jgi:serine/threonine-protein kinase
MDELRQLGRFQLQRVLGRGAMGVVYEGVDPKLMRQVAVKIILKSNINDPAMLAEYSARFIREAQAVARLNHPNIVTVYDFGDENDVAYLVMELIQGKELKDYFDEKRQFALDDAVRIISELLDALDYAHKSGIVHRDIKPANVMLDGQMRVKLTDFGVARLSDNNSERTQAGTMVGTPSYMSPEQIEGAPVGPRSDIFAVGIILYQFLTGEKPFHAQGLWAIQKKIMSEDPVLPTVLNPSLNPAFDAVVLRALAKKADDRYPNAAAFKTELKLALGGDKLEDTDTTRLFLQPKPAPAGPGTGTGTKPPVEAENTGLEIEFWRSIKDSDDAEEFELYIRRFPNGSYVDLAKRKLSKLRGDATSSTSLKPPFAQAEGDDDATRIGTLPQQTPPRPGAAGTLGTAAASVAASAVPAARNKMLLPGIAAAVLVAAGVGFFAMKGGDKPAPVASVPQAASQPTPEQIANAAAEAKRKQEADEKAVKDAEDKKKLEAQLAKVNQELEEAKKAAANDPKKQEALRQKEQEQLAAKKKAEELVKKQAEDAAKKKAEELAKKNTPEPKKPEEPKKPTPEPKKTEIALVDTRKAEEAKKAEEARKQEEIRAAADAAAKAAAQNAAQNAPAPAAAAPGATFADARALEAQGNLRAAVRAYKNAANAGNGPAAKRLYEILSKGQGDVGRDYAESLKWHGKAKERGEAVPDLDKKE